MWSRGARIEEESKASTKKWLSPTYEDQHTTHMVNMSPGRSTLRKLDDVLSPLSNLELPDQCLFGLAI